MSLNRPSEETILEQALSLDSLEERNAYLQRACAGDEGLRKQVESLVEAHTAAGGFLSEKTAKARLGSRPQPATEEKPGTLIGRYKLLEKIGKGGMGVVYM